MMWDILLYICFSCELMNKTALAYGKARLQEIYCESRWIQKDAMKLPKEDDTGIVPVGHSHIVIHRLKEMG